MLHVMKKIADWLIDEELSSSLSCTIDDEIIEEWLENIEDRKNKIEQNNGRKSQEHDMILELEKRVKKIQDIRLKKCQNIKTER